MRTKLLTLLVHGLLMNLAIAQSGSGVLEWYHVGSNCGVPCISQVQSLARDTFTAPIDGTLQITGIAEPYSIDCCGQTYPMTMSGSFRKFAAPANIHTFSSTESTGSLECVKAGDQFEINFSGTYGSYAYSATVIPTGQNDNEPNDDFNSAIPIATNTSYSGHIGYGAYTYDLTDYYEYVPPTNGYLTLNFSHTDRINLKIFDKNYSSVSSQTLDGSSTTFEQHCLAAGEKIYIMLSRLSCADYTFDADFNSPIYGDELEPNNDIATAIIGTDIYGNIGYDIGNGSNDFYDYFELPPLVKDDSVSFDITVDQGPVYFYIRSKTFSGFNYPLGSATNGTFTNFFKPTFDDTFYLRVYTAASSCGSYDVDLSGCVNNLVITGPESDEMDIDANESIISSQVIEAISNVQYRANGYIELVSPFEVDLGALFETSNIGCNN